MAKFRPKEAWGFVSCDDGHYLICTGRVPVTSNTSSARVIGTARDRDTAILMAAAPDMYKLLVEILIAFEPTTDFDDTLKNQLRDTIFKLLEAIDGKED